MRVFAKEQRTDGRCSNMDMYGFTVTRSTRLASEGWTSKERGKRRYESKSMERKAPSEWLRVQASPSGGANRGNGGHWAVGETEGGRQETGDRSGRRQLVYGPGSRGSTQVVVCNVIARVQ